MLLSGYKQLLSLESLFSFRAYVHFGLIAYTFYSLQTQTILMRKLQHLPRIAAELYSRKLRPKRLDTALTNHLRICLVLRQTQVLGAAPDSAQRSLLAGLGRFCVE